MQETGYFIEGTEIEYFIRISKKAKRSRIRLTGDKIEVVGTRYSSKKSLHKFVNSNKEWVIEKYKLLETRLKNFKTIGFTDLITGTALPFLGDDMEVNLTPENEVSTRIEITETAINILVPNKFDENKQLEEGRKHLRKFLKNQLLEIASSYAEQYCKIIGRDFSAIKVKELKTIWGSCTSKSIINLNLQLVTMDLEIIEYLVIHEICHLVHRNHSKSFWGLVASLMPQYKIIERELKSKSTTRYKFS